MTSPGSTTAGDDDWNDTATVFEPKTKADTGIGVPAGSCVGT